MQVSRAPGTRRASSMATARPRAAQAGALLVAGVLEGSAAERAGVAVGDELLAINGCEAASMPEECVAVTRLSFLEPSVPEQAQGIPSG